MIQYNNLDNAVLCVNIDTAQMCCFVSRFILLANLLGFIYSRKSSGQGRI